MASDPIVLTAELLHEYESLVAAQGVPVDWFLPGLTDEVMDQLIRPYGLVLAEETRVWYRWHDGELPRDPSRSWRGVGFGNVYPVTLAKALEDRLSWQATADALAPEFGIPSERWWSPAWLPFLQGQSDTYVCDAPGYATTISPVRFIAPHQMQPSDFWRVRAASLGDMVSLWITAVERGWFWFDESEQWWHRSNDIPNDVVTGSLV